MKKILLSGQKGADPRAYYDTLSPFGLVLPAHEAQDGDILVLGGGGDISPRYAEYSGDLSLVRIESAARDRMELALIARFLSEGKPILGVCRGAQMLAAALGGTLLADLGTDAHGNGLHGIETLPGSLVHTVLGESAIVNSFHHQAVLRPGRDMRVTARAKDGVCEAIEHASCSVLALQWHPERMADTGMRALLARFFQGR